ncbi:MAG: response regulator [Acidobacteriota bacterium]
MAKVRSPRRIRHWLFFLAVAATLPFAILTFIQFFSELRRLRETAEQTSLKEAQAIAGRLAGERSAARSLLEQLAHRPGIRDPRIEENCGFSTFQESTPHYANIALYDLTGTPLCSATPWTPGITVGNQEWFNRLMRTHKAVTSGPEVSPILHDWVVFQAQPVLDSTGAVKNVLVVPVRASLYRDLLKLDATSPNAMAMLIDGQGAIIARTIEHEKWVGKKPAGVEAVRFALGSSATTFRGRGVEGVDRVYGIADVAEQGWRVLVGVPAAIVFAPLRKFIAVQSGVLLSLIALFVALSLFVARRIERPIVALAVEHEVRESRARLAAALDATGVAAWELDLRTSTYRFDEAFALMFDLSPGDSSLPQEVVRSWVHPDDRERVLAEGAQVILGTGERLETEFRQVLPSGRTIWVRTVARVLERDQAGKATRMVGTTRDTTGKRRDEFRLERETELNRTLLNASPAFFLAFDPSGKIIVVNDALLAALGYERDELVNRNFDSIVPAEALDEAGRAFRVLAESLEALALEVPLQTRDGRALLVEWRARPVLAETGQVDFVFAVGIDVGERRRQEIARERYAELLAAVNETAITLLSHHDVEETLTMIATKAAALTGAAGSFVEILDRDRKVMRIVAATGISAPYLGREIEPETGFIGNVHDTHQPVVVDDVQTWAGRTIVAPGIHAAAAVPILSGDEVLGVLGIAEANPTKRISPEQVELLTRLAQLGSIAIDNAHLIADAQREVVDRSRAEEEVRRLNTELEARVRERTAQLEGEIGERTRAKEELRQRGSELAALSLELAAGARMKDEFLANMSHELRTPLNAVLGMAEVLREGIHGPLNEKQNRSLDVISASGTHLLELINDVLDLSKIEAGKVELDLQPVTVKAVAEASLTMVREAAFRKQLDLDLDLDPAVETVDADERRLRQILVNLLSNAVKFTPGGGSVGLEVEGHEPSNQVRFTVRDTGIGIADSQMSRLFTPFFQADSGFTRQYAGTGLGLSLVRRFAELHGGSVDVQSTIGEGSRFSVVLPWRHEGVDRRLPEAVLADPLPRRRREGPLLIIEDDPSAAEQIARYCAELGLQTIVSNGREEPVDLALRTHPSVILLDVLFETTNGWQMLAALRASEQTREIPVIMVSVVDDAARGLALGAAAYLVKPISRETLETTLVRFIPLPLRTRSRERPLVLIAEDNQTNIHLMESYLGAMEIDVIIARDGAAAVAAVHEHRPDLVLMDVQMPVLDGLEATRLIRKSGGSMEVLPIIALTALAMRLDKERCLAAGASDYLTKPVSYKSLEEAIRRLLPRG